MGLAVLRILTPHAWSTMGGAARYARRGFPNPSRNLRQWTNMAILYIFGQTTDELMKSLEGWSIIVG